MTRDAQMKLFHGYRRITYSLRKILRLRRKRKEEQEEKNIFLFRKLIVYAVEN